MGSDGAWIGTLEANDVAVVMLWDETRIERVSLHFADGVVDHEAGIARKATQSKSAAAWRAYHDPHDYWTYHREQVIAAYNRRVAPVQAVESNAIAALEAKIMALLDMVASQRDRLDAMTADNAQMRREMNDLTAEIVRMRQAPSPVQHEGPNPEKAQAAPIPVQDRLAEIRSASRVEDEPRSSKLADAAMKAAALRARLGYSESDAA